MLYLFLESFSNMYLITFLISLFVTFSNNSELGNDFLKQGAFYPFTKCCILSPTIISKKTKPKDQTSVLKS